MNYSIKSCIVNKYDRRYDLIVNGIVVESEQRKCDLIDFVIGPLKAKGLLLEEV